MSKIVPLTLYYCLLTKNLFTSCILVAEILDVSYNFSKPVYGNKISAPSTLDLSFRLL